MISLVAAPLRAVRRATLWWSIGLAALVGVTIAFWPAFRGSSGISEAIDRLPQGVVQAFGLANFGTPAGFLRGNLYDFIVPLLLAAAAVALVNGQTAGEESSGRLELFLAQPVDRGAVFLGRVAAALLAVAIVTLVTVATQLLTGQLVGIAIDAGLVVATIVLCGLLAALYGAFAYAVAGATGKPAVVLATGLGLAVAGYVVSALFPLSDALAAWRHLSPWDWAFGGNPLDQPTDAWRYAALAIPAVALIALGTILVRRRDITSG